MMNKVRVNQGRVMNAQFRILTTLLTMACSFIITIDMNNVLGFTIICILGLLLIIAWTSFHVLEIDMTDKILGKFTYILGRKFGEGSTFTEIIDVSVEEQSSKRTIFQSYLNYDGQKVELISDSDLISLNYRLKPILKKLNTKLRPS